MEYTNDPVRMYLRKMGSVALLTREGEIEIAKRIEVGEHRVLNALLSNAMAFDSYMDRIEASKEMCEWVKRDREIRRKIEAAEEAGEETTLRDARRGGERPPFSLKDLVKSVEKFNKEGDFPFPLAADPKLEVFKKYRCFDDFENLTLHGTFLVDGDGLVRWQDISYDPFMDADFLLSEARRLLGQAFAGFFR